MRRLTVRHERFKLEKPFAISRGSKTHSDVVVAEIVDGALHGRGEAVPYPRYGETVESVLAQIEAMVDRVADGMDMVDLQSEMPPGAARNAIDTALWEFVARAEDKTVWRMAEIDAPHPIVTAFTLGLDTPENMARAAAENAERPVLKLKLTGEGDLERVTAVRRAAPDPRLIVDANEAWTPAHLERFLGAFAELGVTLIEQPLPAGQDEALGSIAHAVPICADESCHTSADLPHLVGRYDAVNIKLDKTGGLTEAIRLERQAREMGFKIMVGCMVGTSLSMAPALLVAQGADFVDLDGPLLLAHDRQPGLRYDGSTIYPPKPNLWG